MSAIALFANALIGARKILALSGQRAVGRWIAALVHVLGTVWSFVTRLRAVTGEAINSVVALAVVLAGHVTIRIGSTVIYVCLAVSIRVSSGTLTVWWLKDGKNFHYTCRKSFKREIQTLENYKKKKKLISTHLLQYLSALFLKYLTYVRSQ